MDSEIEERFLAALHSCYANPFIDDVEDFVWEAVWSYAQGLPMPDPNRSKRLFDVVDESTARGWSAKTLVWPLDSSSCEFVIQRADVFKKADALGFSGLSLDSDPQLIGDAVLTHWRAKVELDAEYQGVADPRVSLLLKSKDRTRCCVVEQPLHLPGSRDVHWDWTNDSRTGLQGRLDDGSLQYRWYQNQKQLFEVFMIPEGSVVYDIEAQRWDAEDFLAAFINVAPKLTSSDGEAF